MRIDENPRAVVCSQKAVVGRSYSAWKTGLPAAMNGTNISHSEYSAHCSFTENSKCETSSGIWVRSFFRPTASPRSCARSAIIRLYASWSRGRQREPGIGGGRVHQIRFDAVEATFRADVEPRRHDRPQHVDLPDVEPLLVGPAIDRVALHRFRELRGVGAVVLPAANFDVADHLAAGRVQRSHHARVVLQPVDVVHRGVHGLVDRDLQLPLPAQAGLGAPDLLLGQRWLGGRLSTRRAPARIPPTRRWWPERPGPGLLLPARDLGRR